MVYGVGDLFSKGLQFLLLPVYLSYLNPSQYGILALATGYAVVAGFLLQLNLNSSVFRFSSDCEDEAEAQTLAGTLIAFQLAWAVILVPFLVLIVPSALASIFQDQELYLSFQLAGLLAFVTSVPVLPLAILQMRGEAVQYRILTVGGSVSATIAILFFVVARGGGANGFLLGQVVGGSLMLAPYGVIAWRRLAPRVDRETLKKCLAFSAPLVPYAVSGWTMDLSNRYLLAHFLGLEDVGRYNAAYQFALIMQALWTAFGLAWVPVFYQLAGEADAKAKLALFGQACWLGTLFLGLALIFGSREALRIFAGGAYADSYVVVPALMASQVLTCTWHLFANPLFLKEKTGYFPVVMAAAAVLSVGLNLALIPRWGIVGAAWAVFGANAFVNTIVGLLSLRCYPIPYRFMNMWVATVAAVATFVVAEALYRAELAGPAAFLSICLFPMILFATRVIRLDDLRTIVRYVTLGSD